MATRTVVRMFDDREHALMAVRDLERAGYTQDEVSLMAAGDAGASTTTTTTSMSTPDDAGSGAGTGAGLGAVLGGGAGLLAGIGALAIPGIGPIVAAGWLVATITGLGAGAAAGGLLGSLVNSGVDEADAHTYTEGVRRGGTLVSVRGSEGRVNQAEQILAGHPAVDLNARSADWRAGGWTTTATATSVGASHGDRLGSMDDRPDGTPGNPSGTRVTRGVDKAAGTNISGAYPGHDRPAGDAGSGTGAQMTPRADDDGHIMPRRPDGTPGNPRGTEVSRGVDQTLGTNISGAHPENEKPRRS